MTVPHFLGDSKVNTGDLTYKLDLTSMQRREGKLNRTLAGLTKLVAERNEKSAKIRESIMYCLELLVVNKLSQEVMHNHHAKEIKTKSKKVQKLARHFNKIKELKEQQKKALRQIRLLQAEDSDDSDVPLDASSGASSLGLHGGCEIAVKTVNGSSFNLPFNPSSTVSDLKKAIFLKEGIPTEAMRLQYKFKELDNRRLLSDYDMQHYDNITLLLRLLGGLLQLVSLSSLFLSFFSFFSLLFSHNQNPHRWLNRVSTKPSSLLLMRSLRSLLGITPMSVCLRSLSFSLLSVCLTLARHRSPLRRSPFLLLFFPLFCCSYFAVAFRPRSRRSLPSACPRIGTSTPITPSLSSTSTTPIPTARR